MLRLARLAAVLLCFGVAATAIPLAGLDMAGKAHADDGFGDRQREMAKLTRERDRDLDKARAEHERELAKIDREADEERDRRKAYEKWREKTSEAHEKYRERVHKILSDYEEKVAKLLRR